MKKYFVLLIAVSFISFFGMAQTKTEPAGPGYNDGETKTTTSSTDGDLTKTITVEIKDKFGTPLSRTTWKKTIQGKLSKEEVDLTPSGKVRCRHFKSTNEKGELIEQNFKGTRTKYSGERMPDGSLKFDDGTTMTPGQVKDFEERLKKEFDDLETNKFAVNVPKQPCSEEGSSCQTQFAAFAGPGILMADLGSRSETFFGGHISFLYSINPHFSAGLDASLHTKKFGTENLTRCFIMAEGMYIIDGANCNRKIIPNIHVLAGLGREKYGQYKGNGFAYGGGVGADLKLRDNLAVRLFQADYILTRFDNESFGNFRVSTGLILRFGNN